MVAVTFFLVAMAICTAIVALAFLAKFGDQRHELLCHHKA